MTNEVDYVVVKKLGNGITVDVPFSFKITDEKSVVVVLENVKSGETITQRLNIDYTVDCNKTGGNVKFVVAPTEEYYIIVSRSTQTTQLKTFSTSPGFQASEIEKSYDEISCVLQEMSYDIKRSIKMPLGIETEDLNLPKPEATKALVWNVDGTGLVNSDISLSDVSDIADVVVEKANIVDEQTKQVEEMKNDVNETYLRTVDAKDGALAEIEKATNAQLGSAFVGEFVESPVPIESYKLHDTDGSKLAENNQFYGHFYDYMKRRKTDTDNNVTYYQLKDKRYSRRLWTKTQPVKDKVFNLGSLVTSVNNEYVPNIENAMVKYDNTTVTGFFKYRLCSESSDINASEYIVVKPDFEVYSSEKGADYNTHLVYEIGTGQIAHEFLNYSQNEFGNNVFGNNLGVIENVRILPAGEYEGETFDYGRIRIRYTSSDITYTNYYYYEPVAIIHTVSSEDKTFNHYSVDVIENEEITYNYNENFLTTREWVENNENRVEYRKLYLPDETDVENAPVPSENVFSYDSNGYITNYSYNKNIVDYYNSIQLSDALLSNKSYKVKKRDFRTGTTCKVTPDCFAYDGITGDVTNSIILDGYNPDITEFNDFNIEYDFVTPGTIANGQRLVTFYRAFYIYYSGTTGSIYGSWSSYKDNGVKYRVSAKDLGITLEPLKQYHLKLHMHKVTESLYSYTLIINDYVTGAIVGKYTIQVAKNYPPLNLYDKTGIKYISGVAQIDLRSLRINDYSLYGVETKNAERQLNHIYLPYVERKDDKYTYIVTANGLTDDTATALMKFDFSDVVMRDELEDVIEKVSENTELSERVEALETGKQPVGDYATNENLEVVFQNIQTSLDEKQPIGDYATNERVDSLESRIPDDSSVFIDEDYIKENYYSKTEIDEKASLGMKYKGDVDTFEDLPTDAKVGDVYNIFYTDENYFWNGVRWDNLGINLVNYYKKDELDSMFVEKIPTNNNQLANGAGYLTTETDPVYMIDKPYIAWKTDLPTNVSELNNDAGFLTSETLGTNYYTKTEIDNLFGDIESLLDEINGGV